MTPETSKLLFDAAVDARNNAYAIYSKFKVGAAALTEDGQIFTGCNIENASFGGTICAERVAISKAICAGYKKIKAILIVAEYHEPISPCGICRQVIAEFGSEALVLMANTKGQIQITSIDKLLPFQFVLPKNNPTEYNMATEE